MHTLGTHRVLDGVDEVEVLYWLRKAAAEGHAGTVSSVSDGLCERREGNEGRVCLGQEGSGVGATVGNVHAGFDACRRGKQWERRETGNWMGPEGSDVRDGGGYGSSGVGPSKGDGWGRGSPEDRDEAMEWHGKGSESGAGSVGYAAVDVWTWVSVDCPPGRPPVGSSGIAIV
jgi:hypothetical protein